jgi:hypothetical protein
MGDTVDALAYKADVKSRAKDSVSEKVDNLKSKVTGARDSVTGTAGDAASSVSDATPSTDDIKHAARRGKGLAQENPLGLAIGSIAVGFLAGMLVPSTRVEDEKLGPMADTLKEQVRETAQVAVDHGKEAAQEAGQAAAQAAKDAAGSHAEDAKSDLRDQAQQGRDQVASSAPTPPPDRARCANSRPRRQQAPRPGRARRMDLTAIVLAPVRIPIRMAKALDDLAVLADRARREPDPVEALRTRVDTLLVELARLVEVAEAIVAGGTDLTLETRAASGRMQEVVGAARELQRTAVALDGTGRELHDGGQDLLESTRSLDADGRELIDGGDRLRQVTEQLEQHLRVFRAALPRVMHSLDTVESIEGKIETVAETVEPLQGAAERVGKVSRRLSRSSS